MSAAAMSDASSVRVTGAVSGNPPDQATSRATVAAAGGLQPSDAPPREKFIPVTVTALIDRLTPASNWPTGDSAQVKRFFRYLEHWRRQRASAGMIELMHNYEPFSPDTDLLVTRAYSAAERLDQQKKVVAEMEHLLKRANYERIDPQNVSMIMTKESHYGLDLFVDFSAFEECLIYFRGATKRRDERRNPRKFYRKEEFDVPIYQRLFLLFKLKPFEKRVSEVMAERKIDRAEAERMIKKLRASLPGAVSDQNIYMKLFKNIPRTDIEMVFPNTRVKFRMFDKIKLGVTGGGAMGAGVFGTAGKLAAGGLAATNPVALIGAVATLGGVAFRQSMNFVNQKNRYMVVMAQNLYFHSMADNRGVALKLSDRAAEEEVKEDILLYSVLAKEPAKHSDLPEIDRAIEKYLTDCFGVCVDFDLEDSLTRLVADGLVVESPDGTLVTMNPTQAALHVDKQWDAFLDEIPSFEDSEKGHEAESTVPPQRPGEIA
ncbi:MAG: TMEM143 family protein [Hyphomicrobium sp.]